MPTENRSNTEQMVSVPKFYPVDAPNAYPEPVGTLDKLEHHGGAIWVHLNGKRSKLVGLQSLAFLIGNLQTIYTEVFGKPAALHQEPVPITNDMHRLMDAYRLGEFKEEGGSNTAEALAVASFDAVESHGHDADSYMAGFLAALYEQAAPFIWLAIKPSTLADTGESYELLAATSLEFGERIESLEKERNTLRAQLAERDALLKQAAGYGGLTPSWHAEVAQILSASAEPTVPVEREEQPGFKLIGHQLLEWNRSQPHPPIAIGHEYGVATEAMRLARAALGGRL